MNAEPNLANLEDDEASMAAGGDIIMVDDDAPSFASSDDSEHLTIVQTDADGEEMEYTIDLAMPPLNEDEAKELTNRIRTTTNVLYLLIKRAHAGRAWAALGYSTFEEYVKEEFKFSRSYAYKLLNQANIIEAIESKAPEGTKVYVGEGIARNLRKVLPEVLAEVEERTEGLDSGNAGAMIEEIIREQRDKQIADEKEEAVREYEGPYTGDYDGYDDDDDDEDDEEEVSSNSNLLDDPADARRKFEKLYALYSSLKSLADLGDGSELIDFIPENRREEFTHLLEVVLPFLTQFNEEWKQHLEEIGEESDSDDEDLDED